MFIRNRTPDFFPPAKFQLDASFDLCLVHGHSRFDLPESDRVADGDLRAVHLLDLCSILQDPGWHEGR